MGTSKKDRVYDAIREKIVSGDLPAGHKMPPIRLLQEEYGVSYGTLNLVINMLKLEKLIVGYQGDAMYVRHKPGEPPED
ncbi:hypothetical protein JCM9534A_56060 [Catenuloplanes indicus JCM 9534]